MPRSKHKDPQNPKTHKDPKTLKNKRQHYKKEKEKEKEKKTFFFVYLLISYQLISSVQR